MSGDGLSDITNNTDKPYESTTRFAMAQTRRNNQSLRNTLLAMRKGMRLMQGEITERKRVREERAAEAAQSSDHKHLKCEKISDAPALARK